MGSSRSSRAPSPVMRAASQKHASLSITENPVAAILAYCGSSILMTVTNKYVLSGVNFNLPFFLLCVQVCQHVSSLQSWSSPCRSLSSAWQPSRYAKAPESSHTGTSTPMKRRSVGIRPQTREERQAKICRVPHLAPPHRHDLHEHLGAQIPFDPRLHHFQELDHHSDRIRRGAMVRRIRHTHGTVLIWSDGIELHHRGLGRHPACLDELWPGLGRRRDRHVDPACRLSLDDVQLPLHRNLRFGHEEAHQVDKLQGFRQ